MADEPKRASALHTRLSRASDPSGSADALSGRCFSVQYRVPADQLRGVLPPGLEVDEIGSTGRGLISVLVSNATALRLGPLRVPRLHACALVSRAAVRAVWDGAERRADWIMLAESSSLGLGRLAGAPRFEVDDDGEVWSLRCTARDPLASGWFTARTAAIDKDAPAGSMFGSAREADELGLETEWICEYDAEREQVSFRPIESNARDVSFCHDFDCEFPLVEYLKDEMGLAVELDCAVLVRDVRPVRQTAFVPRRELGTFPAGAEISPSS